MILRHVTSHAGISILETLNSTERRALPSYLATRLSGERAEVDAAAWEQAAILDIQLEDLTVSAADMQKAFRKRGLFCVADIRARPTDARAALADLLGDVVKRIIDHGG